jgi:hypothetical protein
MRDHIQKRLSIPGTATPEEIATCVKCSMYAHDYFITDDHIRNLREREISMWYKRASRDVDSVLAAVRSEQ